VPIPRAVCLRVDFEGYTIESSDPGLSHQSLFAGIVINRSWRLESGEKLPVYRQVEDLFCRYPDRAASVVKLSGAPDLAGGKTSI
jgi:hypothetical protein